MATGRETVRDALVTLLGTALVGAGLPVKTVSGSKQTSLEGLTPLVVVLGRGSTRERLTFQGDRAIFSFSVQVWVIQSTTGWTYADAEDALDRIEALIAGVCELNNATANWEILQYDGPTTVNEMAVAGVPYYVESINVRVLLGRN